MPKLKYVDKRNIMLPELKRHKGGVALPNNKIDNIIEVDEIEKVWLLRMKNGSKPCFEEIEKRTPRKEINLNEEENGNR